MWWMCIGWSFLRPIEAARILLNSPALKIILLLRFLLLPPHLLGVWNALGGSSCSSFVDSGRHPIPLINSPLAQKKMLFLSIFWMMFTRFNRFSLSHESFSCIGSSCNKPFLSTVMSAFSVIGIPFPVHDISRIFVCFISGFLFFFYNMK